MNYMYIYIYKPIYRERLIWLYSGITSSDPGRCPESYYCIVVNVHSFHSPPSDQPCELILVQVLFSNEDCRITIMSISCPGASKSKLLSFLIVSGLWWRE